MTAKKWKWGMTPTPLKKRQEAARSVFARPLAKKIMSRSESVRWNAARLTAILRCRMFRQIVARLIANLMRSCSANRNQRRYRAAHSAAHKKEGTPDL